MNHQYPSRSFLPLAGALSVAALLLSAGAASAGNLTLNPFAGNTDADSGISTTIVYTHLVDVASDTGDTTVNGVTFLASDPNYSLTGPGNTFHNDNFGPAAGGSGLAKLQDDFLYGGNPAVLTLTGLTPGQAYKLRLYVFGFGGNLQDFSIDDTVVPSTFTGIARNAGTDTVPGSIDYTYTLAPGDTNLAVTITPQNAAAQNPDTFHFYAFSNEVVPEPASLALGLIGGLGMLGLVRRRRS